MKRISTISAAPPILAQETGGLFSKIRSHRNRQLAHQSGILRDTVLKNRVAGLVDLQPSFKPLLLLLSLRSRGFLIVQ